MPDIQHRISISDVEEDEDIIDISDVEENADLMDDGDNIQESFFNHVNEENLLDNHDEYNNLKKQFSDEDYQEYGYPEETDVSDPYEDTVLDTFNQKTDVGSGVADLLAEGIIAHDGNFNDNDGGDDDKTLNEKVILAPTDAGNFVNFSEDNVTHLEEKCFPHLFPHGTGGYMSTYQSKGVWFSNYIKQRLFGIDRRFADDKTYVSFLYHVKEALEIKRSRVTYFRKGKMDKTRYTKETLKDIDKASIERTDMGFRAFKNVRGTAPYFEENKRRLYAMIRQLESPHLFFTTSHGEMHLLHLLKALKEKDVRREVLWDEVREMGSGERYSLLKKYPIEVVSHLDARFKHRVSSLRQKKSLGKYHVADYFYRIEFQQRGSAHIHCMFWLADNKGVPPPRLSLDDTANDEEYKRFHSSIISATSHLKGTEEDPEDSHTRCQHHSHTFSCEKKKKGFYYISPEEGHGAMDGKLREEAVKVPKCRHGFPKFPVPEVTILRKLPSDDIESKQILQMAKNNLKKVKQFLIRQTQTTDEKREVFEKYTFQTF